MKLNRINGTAATEVELPNGNTVLFSYATPVAVHIPGRGYFKTSSFYSRTTSKHIGQFLARNGGSKILMMPQADLDAMGA
jgi:hypothetical protein